MNDFTERYQRLVAIFGTQSKTASALGITQPSVNSLVKGKSFMSPIVAFRAEQATEGAFKKHDLCPDLAAIKSEST